MKQAVARAGKLKPEIRLAMAISEFGACLDKGRQAMFKTLRTNSPPSPDDVIRLSEEINRDGARHHRSWQPHGTRLVGILERIQLFSAVGDILVGGSQNMIASGVWAVVRMSLQLATGYLSYFEKISELLMRIGRSSSIKRDLVLLFPNNQQLQQLMCEYLVVVVDFCKGVVLFTKKPFFAQLAASFTKEFDAFGSDLARLSSDIQERVDYLSTKSQVVTEGLTTTISQKLSLFTGSQPRKHGLDEKLFRLRTRISPHQDEFDLIWRRERKKGTTPWIFDSTSYQEWVGSPESSVLQVTGNLGSGKTVLLANIFAAVSSQDTSNMPEQEKPITACFFCNFGNAKSLESRNIIGSLAYQFVNSLIAEADGAEALAERMPSYISSTYTNELVDFVAKLLPQDRSYYVVLDALDECAEQEVEEVATAISKLLMSHKLRVCFSTRTESRTTGIVTGHLSVQHKISMATTDRHEELKAFIAEEIERRKTLRPPLDPHTLQAIKQFLIDKANGMYLWVILQIEAIFPRYAGRILCDADVPGILESLPGDLPQAFDRALRGITDHRYGSRLFETVAAAQRPLTLDELRVALNVKLGNLEWDESTFPYDARNVVYLSGGGLLEVDEEDLTVDYIHSSALKYLSRPLSNKSDPATGAFHFSMDIANMRMGYLCITYLNYAIFETRLTRFNDTGIPMSSVSAAISSTVKQEASKNPLLGAVVGATRWFYPSEKVKPCDVNIAELLQKYRGKNDTNVRSFYRYAHDHWLLHSRIFLLEEEIRTFHSLLNKLLNKSQSLLEFPWGDGDQADAMEWAVREQHLEVFRILIPHQQIPPSMLLAAVKFITAWPDPVRVRGNLLGDIVAQSLKQPEAFSEACALEYVDILQKLVSHGADPSICSSDGKAPLELCSQFPAPYSLRYTETLLQAGADPDCSLSSSGRGSGVLLCLAGSLTEHLSLFLQHGADANVPLTKELLDEKFPNNKIQHTDLFIGHALVSPLSIAIWERDVESVEILLQHGAAVNGSGEDINIPVRADIKVNDYIILSILLDAGASPDRMYKHDSLLVRHLATANRPGMLRLFIQSGANLYHDNIAASPLILALKAKRLENALIMLTRSRCSARELNAALYIVVNERGSGDDDVEFLRRLLELGVDANGTSPATLGFTEYDEACDDPPLVSACRRSVESDDISTVRTLLQFGAEPDLAGPSGNSAIEYCAPGSEKHELLLHYQKDYQERAEEAEIAVQTLDIMAFQKILFFGSLRCRPWANTGTSDENIELISKLAEIACTGINMDPEGSGEETLRAEMPKRLYIVYSLLGEGPVRRDTLALIERLLNSATEQDFCKAFVDFGLRARNDFGAVPYSWMPRNIAGRRGMYKLLGILSSEDGYDYIPSTLRSEALAPSSSSDTLEGTETETRPAESETGILEDSEPRLRDKLIDKHLWTPDSGFPECSLCRGVFNTYQRKHHCRVCGMIFHLKCAEVIDGKEFGVKGPIVICNNCVLILERDADGSNEPPGPPDKGE